MITQTAARWNVDQESLDRIAERRRALAAAHQTYEQAQFTHRPLSEVRAAMDALTAAYTELIAETTRHPRTMRGLTEQLQDEKQRLILDAPLGVLPPVTVRVASNAPLGPLIPGMDFDLDDPQGPPTERSWGIDMMAQLDGEPEKPESK
jgi:hypothetical protein